MDIKIITTSTKTPKDGVRNHLRSLQSELVFLTRIMKVESFHFDDWAYQVQVTQESENITVSTLHQTIIREMWTMLLILIIKMIMIGETWSSTMVMVGMRIKTRIKEHQVDKTTKIDLQIICQAENELRFGEDQDLQFHRKRTSIFRKRRFNYEID